MIKSKLILTPALFLGVLTANLATQAQIINHDPQAIKKRILDCVNKTQIMSCNGMKVYISSQDDPNSSWENGNTIIKLDPAEVINVESSHRNNGYYTFTVKYKDQIIKSENADHDIYFPNVNAAVKLKLKDGTSGSVLRTFGSAPDRLNFFNYALVTEDNRFISIDSYIYADVIENKYKSSYCSESERGRKFCIGEEFFVQDIDLSKSRTNVNLQEATVINDSLDVRIKSTGQILKNKNSKMIFMRKITNPVFNENLNGTLVYKGVLDGSSLYVLESPDQRQKFISTYAMVILNELKGQSFLKSSLRYKYDELPKDAELIKQAQLICHYSNKLGYKSELILSSIKFHLKLLHLNPLDYYIDKNAPGFYYDVSFNCQFTSLDAF